MKRLKFEELWLLSIREKKARYERLSDDVTAIVADNEFGKSSLIKSLYAALGADPYKMPEAWKNAQVTILLRFKIDSVAYYILRIGPTFSLFDGNGHPIWSAIGLTKNVAPRLSPMLDFNIELTGSNGDAVSPLPAFCFMPFYIDQDNGWNETWESFSGVSFVRGYKDDIANFHTGIRPKEYYLAKVEKTEASNERLLMRQERTALDRAIKRIKDHRSTIGIAFDPEAFGDRIEELLKEQNALQHRYDAVKGKVAERQAIRTMAFAEMEIAKKVLEELDADVKFLQKIDEPEIHCPVCNTVHKNDFANRFGLMNDADVCRTVHAESRQRVEELDRELARELRQVSGVEAQIDRITALLEEKRGEIKLGDMLRDESERLVDETFTQESAAIDQAIGEIDRKIELSDAKMKEFASTKRKSEITEFYVARLTAFCQELGIATVPDNILRSVRPVITEAGSAKPRLLLAYYYAILHTIAKFSTSCFCPIVIDTPLQQDQDPSNAERMIRFAIDRRPEQSQLVLATGNLHGVEVPGITIIPGTKRSLLEEDQFENVKAFVDPFIVRSME